MGSVDIEAKTLEKAHDRIRHLELALESRIVIEQAKGVLAERYGLTVDDAFLLLRGSARAARTKVHTLAGEVVCSRQSPQAVLRGLARDGRLRAIAMRERVEATVEQAAALHHQHLEQLDRLARWTDKHTARIRTDTRSDAADLAARLTGYRWYLIVPDEQHWEVVIEFNGRADQLPVDLRQRLGEWLKARSLPLARIRLGGTQVEMQPEN